MKVFLAGLILLYISCKKDEMPSATADTRPFRMGFQNSAPRFDSLNLFIQSLNTWTTRADAAIISVEVPWKALLNGQTAENYVSQNYQGLVTFYRSKNLMLWVYIDPENGLDRTKDANELTGAGKSITQPDEQALYRRFTVVMDSMLKPEHIGLALETNLIRSAASPAIYNAIKKAANDVAKELKLRKSLAKLSISIQADHAWGKLTSQAYQGIDEDFTDFPFIEELGISSYPYLAFGSPADIPQDYYSRLIKGKNLPVFVSEGGWSSRTITTGSQSFVSSDEVQKQYIERHEQLLNSVKATALFQLTFTDIDLKNLPVGISSNISYFAYLGLVDTGFKPKPSLNAWDEVFKKKLK